MYNECPHVSHPPAACAARDACTFFVAFVRRDRRATIATIVLYRESFAAVPGLEVHPGSLSRRRCGSRCASVGAKPDII